MSKVYMSEDDAKSSVNGDHEAADDMDEDAYPSNHADIWILVFGD